MHLDSSESPLITRKRRLLRRKRRRNNAKKRKFTKVHKVHNFHREKGGGLTGDSTGKSTVRDVKICVQRSLDLVGKVT